MRCRDRPRSADPGEGIEMREADIERLGPSHRKPGQSPTLTLSDHGIMGLDKMGSNPGAGPARTGGTLRLPFACPRRHEGCAEARLSGMTTIIGTIIFWAWRLSRIASACPIFVQSV